MPAEPEPEAEKEEASERHRHEGPEEVRQGGPLGTADQPDALPDEERSDDPEPPNDRDRPHTRHLRGHRDRSCAPASSRSGRRRISGRRAGFGRLIHHVPLSRSPSLPIHRGRGRSTWNEFTNGRRAIVGPGPTPSRTSRSSAAWTPRTSSASWTTSSTRSTPSSKRTPRSLSRRTSRRAASRPPSFRERESESRLAAPISLFTVAGIPLNVRQLDADRAI